MSDRLAGKRAIVVGAGQQPGAREGMGRATAMLFASEGARLFLVDINADSVHETAELITAEGHEAPTVMVGDILDGAECQRVADDAVRAMGGIDVLQNTVGIVVPGDPTTDPDELWDRYMDINVKAMWRVSKSVLAVMREQRSGSVINYSSLAALPGQNYGIYGISKAAVNAMTMTLAEHNAKYHIRVNAIMPGLIASAMGIEGNAAIWDVPVEEVIERRNKMLPMGYAGDSWDCARLGLYLASDDSRYISGACIPVDGAYFTRVAGPWAGADKL
jgi:NAD(P)-dependent dehydrogenase (short-subunit alcohol dehydrogenase family)